MEPRQQPCLIDNHIVKNLVPADMELDEQILLRMASGNYIILSIIIKTTINLYNKNESI